VKGITLSKNLTTNEHKIKSVEARSLCPVIPIMKGSYFFSQKQPTPKRINTWVCPYTQIKD